MRAQQYGAELDYMLTLVGNKGYQPFNLAAIVGASYNYFNANKLDIDNKNVSSIGGKIALQASYNLNRKLSLFIEPSFTILPKYYKGKDADDVFVQSGVNIGVTYSFKDKYKTSRKAKNEAFADKTDIQEIKDKMNRMLEEIKQLKQESQNTQKVEAGKNIVIEPAQQKGIISVDIHFDEFSSFISEEQAGKLNNIGEWMTENPAVIKIVAFSNDVKDKKAETELRNKRTEAIKKMLVEKYNIAPERIASAAPESMGYANKTGNNAMIIFIPSNKQKFTSMTIAIDFDGTIVEHRYPKIGNEIPFAIDTLKMLIKAHHRLILWTVREGKLLDEAVEWCRERGVEFYAINRDYPEEDTAHHGFSRKVKADIFIDDRNLGGLPDWGDIYRMVQEKLTYEELYRDNDKTPPSKKGGLWSFLKK